MDTLWGPRAGPEAVCLVHTGGSRHHRYAHTDARSAKKDVISTKPQKAMGAERTFPREDKESRRTPSLRSVPRYVSPLFGARYPVQSGQVGARRSPISPVYGWVLSLVSERGQKVKNISFFFEDCQHPITAS